MTQIYVGETRHRDTRMGRFNVFCVTYNLFKLRRDYLWCDWDVFDNFARHYSPCFIVLAEALRTIIFTLFVGVGPITASNV